MNKKARHQFIKEVISKNRIGQQEELLKRLAAKGYNQTQATLSRDLKELQIGRIVDANNGYMYVLPETINSVQSVAKQIESNSITSIAFSNNLCVLKTQTGYAAAIALKIDNLQLPEILGTIAGDDTILIIPTEGIKKPILSKVLMHKIPDLTKLF